MYMRECPCTSAIVVSAIFLSEEEEVGRETGKRVERLLKN